jgi:PAS domain S-box-containing protein
LEDGVYLEINEGLTKLTGYTPKEIIGHSPTKNGLSVWANDEDRLA